MNQEMDTSRWRTGGFIVIFSVIMFAFIFVPHFVTHEKAYVALQCAFFVMMLAIVFSIRSTPILGAIELGCLVPFILFDSLSLYYQTLSYMLVAYAFSAIFLFVVILDLTRSIIYSPHINTNLIFGSLTAYLLVGVFWGKLYFIENLIYPGSFHSFHDMLNFKTVAFADSYNLQFNLIYYSFTVLTTLGIGDIIPIYNQARSLTLMEAICGQVFLGTIIAKLVATWHYPMDKNCQGFQKENEKVKSSNDKIQVL